MLNHLTAFVIVLAFNKVDVGVALLDIGTFVLHLGLQVRHGEVLPCLVRITSELHA